MAVGGTAQGSSVDSKLPSLIDKYVGRRLRGRRRELKLSQEALADRLGLTFQQIQKYERGANRISAGRLYELAQELETTIPYFFQGVEAADEGLKRGVAEEGEAFVGQLDTDAVDLMIAYQAIREPEVRKNILSMAKKSAETTDTRNPDKNK